MFTTVTVQEQPPRGWVVIGAESSVLDVSLAAGSVADAEIEVDVVAATPPEVVLVARVPPLGTIPTDAPAVDTTSIPRGADGTSRIVLGAADGPTVLVVTDGMTATVRPFTVDSTTGASVEEPSVGPGPDDGTPGWPGAVARRFDDPQSAALAFAGEVLGFPEPAPVEGGQRPTASGDPESVDVDVTPLLVGLTTGIDVGPTTTITVHDTGTARGWVVVGASTADVAIVDQVRTGNQLGASGTAPAGTLVAVTLLDLEGNRDCDTTGGTVAGDGTYTVSFDTDTPSCPIAAAPAFVVAGELEQPDGLAFRSATVVPFTG